MSIIITERQGVCYWYIIFSWDHALSTILATAWSATRSEYTMPMKKFIAIDIIGNEIANRRNFFANVSHSIAKETTFNVNKWPCIC